MKIRSLELTTITSPRSLGDLAYRSGQDNTAASQFAVEVDRASAAGDIGGEMFARRWEGNSLLWAGRVEEAARTLAAVAGCRDPAVDPGVVFAAMTDLAMLCQFHGTSAQIDTLVADASAYLEAMGRTQWDHRLLMHRAIVSCNRGELVSARRLAVEAWERCAKCCGGPQYSEMSHFRWIVRPSFFARDLAGADDALQQSERYEGASVTDEQARRWMHVQVLRLRRCAHYGIAALAEHASAALPIEVNVDPKETTFDIGRALILTGKLSSVDRLRWREAGNWPFERALFAFDLEFNRALLVLGREPVDLEFDAPPSGGETLVFPEALQPALATAARELFAAVAVESTRLVSDFPQTRAARRFAWQAALFRVAPSPG